MWTRYFSYSVGGWGWGKTDQITQNQKSPENFPELISESHTKLQKLPHFHQNSFSWQKQTQMMFFQFDGFTSMQFWTFRMFTQIPSHSFFPLFLLVDLQLSRINKASGSLGNGRYLFSQLTFKMVSRKSPSLTFPVIVYWTDTNMKPHRNIYSPKISIITLFGDSLQSANPIVKKIN